MAQYPQSLKKRVDLNLRLGIKSSLPHLRSVIASLYIFYLASNRKSTIIYADEKHDNGYTKLVMQEHLASYINDNYGNEFVTLVQNSPLFSAQLESLQVGLELFFHLAKVNFTQNGLSERTGSNRYQKQLLIASNLCQLDIYLDSQSKEDVNKLLLAWLRDTSVNSKIEDKMLLMLSYFSEDVMYKMRTAADEKEIVFQKEGIYSGILEDGAVISDDAKEQVGPFRILKAYVASDMHPFIKEQNHQFILKGNEEDLRTYASVISNTLDIYPPRQNPNEGSVTNKITHETPTTTPTNYDNYLRALRTKPFLLLAGISGTGKSRIVREFAFKSCPSYLQDKDHTTPGNYCMIEVKPNWHDSSELLGYYSNISKNYQFKKFVKFLVKAKMNPEVPFFVCLDEMNLAPVEQYFAEFLSLLETRKNVEGHAATGVLVDGNYFVEKQETKDDKGNIIMTREIRRTDGQWYTEFFKNTMSEEEKEIANAHTEFSLIEKGLTLPDNVFIIGTVNMDDTTHQFSRKVIDRAMTIEMNGGNLEEMFGHSADLDYTDTPNPLSDFQPKYITADEVLNAHSDVADNIMADLPAKLEEINKCLEGTPFQVSYRVLNELCIYLGVLLEDGVAYQEAVDAAVDQITLMKILPRIEGDQDMFTFDGEKNKLEKLMEKFTPETASYKKLEEMNKRLDNGFTRFWP